MTKKDFEAIARRIAGQRLIAPPHTIADDERHTFTRAYEEARRNVAVAIAETCAADTPRFNRARFLRACGVEGE